MRNRLEQLRSALAARRWTHWKQWKHWNEWKRWRDWRTLTAVGVATLLGGGTLVNVRNDVRDQPHPVAQYITQSHTAAPAVAKAAPAAAPTWDLANIDNSRVDKWVKRFSTSLSSELDATLGRMTQYRSMITGKLAARDMPQDLIYLAAIESEFKPTAKSRVSATGLWQFMSATAKHYGLTVSHKVDERKDPAKSTDAALAYLSDLHDRFGSWYLAAAAYNAGPGTVSKALKKVTGRTQGTDADYYRISSHLPAETRDYVPKMIAVARLAKGDTADVATDAQGG